MKKFTLAAAFAALTLSVNAQGLNPFVTTATEETSLATIQAAKDVVLVGVSEQVHAAFEQLGTIKTDLSIDDQTRHLWIWEGTYEGGTPSGMNSVGLPEGWFSFVVTNVGWSGLSITYDSDDITAITDNMDDYILHIAMKSNDNATHVLGIGECKMSIGETAFVDGEKGTYQIVTNFPRDGKWYNIDIPMSVIKNFQVGPVPFANDGPDFAHFKGNFLWFLSGGVAGTTLDFDQVFFYKPGEVDPSGIKSVKAENANAAVYNLAGQKVGADYKGIVVKNGKKVMQ